MTMPSLDESKRIVHVLLEENLIACAHLFPAGISIYRWEGQVMESLEHIVIAKTLCAAVPQVQKRFQDLHSYDCPVILTIPLEEAPPAILAWLMASVSPSVGVVE